jgi:predicted ArsR family transcriptional regulator
MPGLDIASIGSMVIRLALCYTKGGNIMKGKDKILLLLANSLRLGLTDEEIASSLDMNPSSARTRRSELEQEGLVIPIGFGKTKSGRRTYLWAATNTIRKG